MKTIWIKDFSVKFREELFTEQDEIVEVSEKDFDVLKNWTMEEVREKIREIIFNLNK